MLAAKILIADDDRDTAEMLADLLRLHGHSVAVAFDGSQAVEMARSFLPGLALIDISMPLMNGYEAARLISSEKTIGVLVALTSHASPDEVDVARQAGFDHHFPKGVGGDVLLALIDALVVKHNLAAVVTPTPAV